MTTPPRRSARLAAKAPDAPVKAAPNKAITPEERYYHLVATSPNWSAYDTKLQSNKALRDLFQTSPHEVPAIQEVVDSVADLKARIIAATTAAEFRECAATADAIDEKAERIGWADEMATTFLADTRTWCNEAAGWLEWMAARPSQAAALAAAIAQEESGDYSVSYVSSASLLPDHLNTVSLKDAHEQALGALASFVKCMF